MMDRLEKRMTAQVTHSMISKLLGAGLVGLTLITLLGSAANAALLIEEGFAAGGASPAASEYQSDPASTTGKNNDSIVDQGPGGAVGFNAGVLWTEAVGVGSIAYPEALDTGLEYTDTEGSRLNTTAGAADWHRDTLNSSLKVTKRVTNLPVGAGSELPAVAYFSALMQFTSGLKGQIELHQLNRELIIGFDTSGHIQVAVQGSGSGGPVAGTTVFAAGTTHLVFGQISNGSPDAISIWVDPTDMSNPMGDTVALTSSAFGSGWVVNPSYTVDALHLTANLVGGDQFIFDEIRLGETAEDVLPYTPVTGTVVSSK